MTRNVVILGAGESGVGAALLAKKQGYHVWVSDGGMIKDQYKQVLAEYAIPFEEQGHSLEKLQTADYVVKSPGIRPRHTIVQQCLQHHINLIDEIEFAFLHKGTSKIVSITGANGKTTTTSLLYHIVRAQTPDVAVVGNIGNSFSKQIATSPKSIYVVEVSSFQLDYTEQYHSHISILTNITPDHLDEYDHDMENYIHSKFRVVRNQTAADFFIYNSDDPITESHIRNFSINSQIIPISMKSYKNEKGTYVVNNEIVIRAKEHESKIPFSAIPLIGKHNQYNAMAAATAATALDIRRETIQKALTSFTAVDHRMEFLGTFQGVTFINDSKATNVNATWYALESMTNPVVLLLGGKDKGNDYSDIIPLVKDKVKAIVCIGVDNTKITQIFSHLVPHFEETQSMDEAVKKAFNFSTRGDVILLSPACASFDLFANYEDRGNKFKEAMMKL